MKMNGLTPIIGAGGKTGARVAQRLAPAARVAGGVAPHAPALRLAGPAHMGTRAAWRGPRLCHLSARSGHRRADADIVELARLGREAGFNQMVRLLCQDGAQRAEQAPRSNPALLERGPGQLASRTPRRCSWDGSAPGCWPLPAGPVPEPFIDADGDADVATATLTNPALRNHRSSGVTGPRPGASPRPWTLSPPPQAAT